MGTLLAIGIILAALALAAYCACAMAGRSDSYTDAERAEREGWSA